MNTDALGDQEVVRLQKKEALEALGINPYPAEGFDRNATAEELHAGYKGEDGSFTDVRMAGRIMGKRVFGVAGFITLEDATGSIEVLMKRDLLCPGGDRVMYEMVFKKLVDRGDIVGVVGYMFMTKKGTMALCAKEFRLLSKALKPLPAVKKVGSGNQKKTYYALADVEDKYRQRYIDLLVNPAVRDRFRVRTQVVNCVRRFLDRLGCLEVETPVLQPIYGGASARPFITHHHKLDVDLFLRISNELYLKRLIVGGYEGVYEFAKDFRNEGMSRFHNPEFSMVEVYVAYQDYYWMMEQVECLLGDVALAVHGGRHVSVGGCVLDFTPPFKRYTMAEAIRHFAGIEITGMEEKVLRGHAERLGVRVEEGAGIGKMVDEIFSKCCEPYLVQPTFVMDYPIAMSPLAKRHRTKEGLVERFELICNGKELCNAFTELNDPVEQRVRFEEQLVLGRRGDAEAMVLDEAFLQALCYGMPPTVGMGMGMDRLVMLMTDVPSIQDVLFFPQMRSKQAT